MRGRMGGMRFRKLKIAWSVVCCIASVLLIALWVRSYSQTDYLNRQSPPSFLIQSHRGQLTYMSGLPERIRLRLLSGQMHFDPASASPPPVCGFGVSRPVSSMSLFFLPHWSVVLLTSALGGISWLRWRFTLRTLLVAMALVAILLGLAVHFSTRPPAEPPVDHIDAPEL
jgi:hypothetical protein